MSTSVDLRQDTVVAVYNSHREAEEAIKALQKGGFDMTQLSIVGRDYHTHEQVVGYYNIGNRMCAWSKVGAFWGGIWGLLFGWAFFWIPGIGPVLLAGPVVGAILAGLEGALVGAGVSALGAALASLGIPKNSILDYETAVQAGQYLLMLHGTQEQVSHGKAILELTNHQGLATHAA